MKLRGAFVDTRGIYWDSNNADYEGYLLKRSRWMSQWRKRYFILKGSKLFFAKAIDSSPHGLIDLVDSVSVKTVKLKEKYALIIKLKNEKFILYSESAQELDNWKLQLFRSVHKYSSIHNADFGNDIDESIDATEIGDDELILVDIEDDNTRDSFIE